MSQELSFQTIIDIYDFGKYVYTVIYYPKHITDQIAFHKSRARATILINFLKLDVGLIQDKVGSNQTKHLLQQGYVAGEQIWYSIISKKNLKILGVGIGDQVHVCML